MVFRPPPPTVSPQFQLQVTVKQPLDCIRSKSWPNLRSYYIISNFNILTFPQILNPKSKSPAIVRGIPPCSECRFGKRVKSYEIESNPERAATLCGIDLDIPASQTVALTGSNGAGTTTLLALILRFSKASAGDGLLDGQPVETLRLADLRRQIAVVPQRPLLFDGSVAETIGFGRIDASQAQIEDAARLAQAHDFIMTLPKSYETRIGSHGVRLSGGQGQRIACNICLATSLLPSGIHAAKNLCRGRSYGQEAADLLPCGRAGLGLCF